MNLGLTLGGRVFASMHETLASNPSTVKEMLKYRKVRFHKNDGGPSSAAAVLWQSVSVISQERARQTTAGSPMPSHREVLRPSDRVVVIVVLRLDLTVSP